MGEASAISDIGWLDNEKICVQAMVGGKWHYLILNRKLGLADTLIRLKNNIVPAGFIENFSLSIRTMRLSLITYIRLKFIITNWKGIGW